MCTGLHNTFSQMTIAALGKQPFIVVIQSRYLVQFMVLLFLRQRANVQTRALHQLLTHAARPASAATTAEREREYRYAKPTFQGSSAASHKKSRFANRTICWSDISGLRRGAGNQTAWLCSAPPRRAARPPAAPVAGVTD